MPTALSGWIDTHVHWDAAEFDPDRDAVLRNAFEAGVSCTLNPSVAVSGIPEIQALSNASLERDDWPQVWPAYGIHPLYVEQAQPMDVACLETFIKAHRPIALGEIGLDGYTGAPAMTIQQRWFEDQLALAIEYELPVIMHVRHAVEAVIHTLKRVQGKHRKLRGGIAHAYNGSAAQAAELIRLGFLLGFGGSLTYDGSTRIRRLATELPVQSIVLETDSPDMSPSWLRHQRNEPSALPKIAGTFALLRAMPVEAIRLQVNANVIKLFPELAA